MMHQIKRMEIIRDYIKKILVNQEIDCDEVWWETPEAGEELAGLAGGEENFVTSSEKLNIDIDGDEKLLFTAFRKWKEFFWQDIQNQAELLVKDSKASALQLVFFVKNMRSRVRLEQTFDQNQKNKLLSSARNAAGNASLTLRVTYILDQTYESQTVRLKNLKRHEIMQIPPISGKVNLEERTKPEGKGTGAALNAMVFTTDLFQLVEFYNLIGDWLFKSNVRFGISEFLGVDYSIRRTLEEEPEYFWFKNNGVTLLVDNQDFVPHAAESLPLGSIGPDKEPDFSVINGAQTISTAASYFFELESKPGMEEKLKRAKSAQVLIRIIHVPRASTKEQQAALAQKAKEISVALNRQKPIKVEDIAFTVPFSEKLAGYLAGEYKAGRAEFQLVRRGEGSDVGQWLDLVQFSRARLACAGKPGEARSQSAKTFLAVRHENGVSSFENTRIFVDGWMQAEGEEEMRLFRRHYGAVWFAHRTAEEYEKCRRGITPDDADVVTVIRNGKWYFTAAVTQIMNQFAEVCESGKEKQPDYTDFKAAPESICDRIPQAMVLFAEAVVSCVRSSGKYGRIDSNLFKNSLLYEELAEGLKTGHYPGIKSSRPIELLEEFVRIVSPELAERFMSYATAAAAVSQLPADRYAGYVSLKGQEIQVKSVADAMLETVYYILENYAVDKDKLLETCNGWLTDSREVIAGQTGYFRTLAKEFTIHGVTYWLGTSSSTKVKTNQMKALCSLAGVVHGEIGWHVKSPDTPEFMW